MKACYPICAIAAVLAFSAGAKGEESAIRHVDATAAAELLATEKEKEKPVVIDVRTPEEFEAGHIEGARNINIADQDFEDRLASLDREQPYLVHCRSGGRSTRALESFRKLDFENIYHLDGGILAWKEAGLDLEP